jgi:hypothetical protein
MAKSMTVTTKPSGFPGITATRNQIVEAKAGKVEERSGTNSNMSFVFGRRDPDRRTPHQEMAQVATRKPTSIRGLKICSPHFEWRKMQ